MCICVHSVPDRKINFHHDYFSIVFHAKQNIGVTANIRVWSDVKSVWWNKIYKYSICIINFKINVTSKGVILLKNVHKFDLCYYWEVNSLPVKYSVVSKWSCKQLWGLHYYFILLAMVLFKIFISN